MEYTVVNQGMFSFLFGIFCAYWAQETNRNAWGWFFFGLILPPFAGIILCILNSDEKKQKISNLPPHLENRIKQRAETQE